MKVQRLIEEYKKLEGVWDAEGAVWQGVHPCYLCRDKRDDP